MLEIQCAGCLRMISINKTKKIGKYYYCTDCLNNIKTKLKSNKNET